MAVNKFYTNHIFNQKRKNASARNTSPRLLSFRQRQKQSIPFILAGKKRAFALLPTGFYKHLHQGTMRSQG